MVRNKGKLYVVGETNTKGKLEDDVDALFRLPLAEFTGAHNTRAARLKKTGVAMCVGWVGRHIS